MLARTDTNSNFGIGKEGRKGCIRSLKIPFLIAAFAGALYVNSLGNQFTNWDDGMIYANSSIRHLTWEGIKGIFTPVRASMYQPIRMLSYAVDYRLWGLNPFGYHLTNTLFYILTCVMVFFTLHLLSSHLRREAEPDSHFRVALFGVLLFVAHPVHVEAVSWLSARKEVLQGFFFFMAFYLYLRGREEQGQKRIILLCFVLLTVLLAILSKPATVVFPAVLLVYEISREPNEWIRFLRKYWLFFALSVFVSLIFASVMIKVMLDSGGIKAFRGGSLLNNFLLGFYILDRNIKLLILTINYSAAYGVGIPDPVLGPTLVLAIGMTLLLAGLSLWLLKKTKVVFFSFFFFLITLVPYLNVLPISTLLADRYLFIASFSYCFLLGIVFNKFYALQVRRFSKGFFKVFSTAIFLFLIAGYSFMTVHQNTIWENSYTLWADAVEKQPESNTANALMGVVYMELGMDEKAQGYLERAVKILPYDYESRNNLGIVYGRLGQPDRALRELTTAIYLKPDSAVSKINLSVHYMRQKEYSKSVEILKGLLSNDPRNAILHYRLGAVYREMGDCSAAIAAFTRSMELSPNVITPYEELGNTYLQCFNDVEKAKYYYRRGIEAAPNATSEVNMVRGIIQDLESR